MFERQVHILAYVSNMRRNLGNNTCPNQLRALMFAFLLSLFVT